jgi:CBS domain-containing protein
MKAVRDIMTKTVETVHYDTAVGHLEDIFAARNISAAPLVDDQDKIVGIVTKSDISRFDSMGDDPFFVKVYSIANPKVVTVQPATSVADAGQKMLDEHVHHLVVIEGEAIVGLLSAFDFVKLAATHSREN